MIYSIDTDIIIYFLKNNPVVIEKFNATDIDDMTITIINYTELLFGAYNSSRVSQNLSKIRSFLQSFKIVQFSKQSAEMFAQLKSLLKKSGSQIADMDLMIASICLTNNLTLVTNNIKHFSRITGLRLENWSSGDISK
ncbi:type II toxin-antitoxin system VapC family toxin [candidate division KSB1 bacterium]|nr:type II toxin-antitoxin system VapC family toxin [candidate division KSB1 bacterium]